MEARAIADLLIKSQEEIPDTERNALITSLIVAYARPFTWAQVSAKKRIIPMGDFYIPKEYKALHENHLNMRNQVFGHKDVTRPVHMGAPLNQVRITITGREVLIHTTVVTRYRKDKLEDTAKLLSIMIGVIESRIDEFILKHAEAFPAKNGEYALNVEEPTKTWVFKNK